MLIVSGLVGAAVTAIVMDQYHCYRLVLKVDFLLALGLGLGLGLG